MKSMERYNQPAEVPEEDLKKDKESIEQKTPEIPFTENIGKLEEQLEMDEGEMQESYDEIAENVGVIEEEGFDGFLQKIGGSVKKKTALLSCWMVLTAGVYAYSLAANRQFFEHLGHDTESDKSGTQAEDVEKKQGSFFKFKTMLEKAAEREIKKTQESR